MIRNELIEDIEGLCYREGISKAEVGRRLGKSRQTVSNILRAEVTITTGYIELVEALGYDIELEYRRHGEE